MDLLLAIEGGGSKTRLLLSGADGTVVAREVGGSSSGLYASPEQFSSATISLLDRILLAADKVQGEIRAVGIAGPMDRTVMEEILRKTLGPVPIVIASEGDIAFECCGVTWGVALVAGTGASCQLRTEDGAQQCSGGFGPQFGDEGSGYWIGRAAVSAAMLAEDGRGTPTALTEALRAHFGVDSGWNLLRHADRSGHVPAPYIAAFAPSVFCAAEDGDAVAAGICASAGRHLAELVVTAASSRTWRTAPVPLVCTGGVFHGKHLILDSFEQTLESGPVPFALYPPVTEPCEGLLRLLHGRLMTGTA